MPRTGGGGFGVFTTMMCAGALGVGMPATASAAGCAHAHALPGEASIRVLNNAVTCLINQQRTSHGLGALSVGKRLWVAAYGHARDMRDQHYFNHTSLDGRTFVDRIRAARYMEGRDAGGWTVGEDLAWAPQKYSQPADLVEAVMESPSHREVLLDPRYVELGVALVRGTPAGDADGTTLTVDFGSLISTDGGHQPAPKDAPAEQPPPAQPQPQQPAPQDAGDQHGHDDGHGHDDNGEGKDKGKGKDKGGHA